MQVALLIQNHRRNQVAAGIEREAVAAFSTHGASRRNGLIVDVECRDRGDGGIGPIERLTVVVVDYSAQGPAHLGNAYVGIGQSQETRACSVKHANTQVVSANPKLVQRL